MSSQGDEDDESDGAGASQGTLWMDSSPAKAMVASNRREDARVMRYDPLAQKREREQYALAQSEARGKRHRQ